jgi:hypothetical protein
MCGISTWYRIAAQTGVAWILKPEGNLRGELVNQLRREWERLRETTPEVPIHVELAAVEWIDPKGETLLSEMCSAGVRVDSTERRPGRSSKTQAGLGRADEPTA